MARITLRQLLDHAAEHSYGVPAFNVNNLEQVTHIVSDMTDRIADSNEISSRMVSKYTESAENIDSIEASWLEEGKDVFLKNKKLNRINEHIYKYCNTFIENFKLD